MKLLPLPVPAAAMDLDKSFVSNMPAAFVLSVLPLGLTLPSVLVPPSAPCKLLLLLLLLLLGANHGNISPTSFKASVADLQHIESSTLSKLSCTS